VRIGPRPVSRHRRTLTSLYGQVQGSVALGKTPHFLILITHCHSPGAGLHLRNAGAGTLDPWTDDEALQIIMAHPTPVAGLEQAIFNVNGSARLKSVRQTNQAFLQNPEVAEFFIIYLSFQLHYARGKVCPLFQRIGLLVEQSRRGEW